MWRWMAASLLATRLDTELLRKLLIGRCKVGGVMEWSFKAFDALRPLCILCTCT